MVSLKKLYLNPLELLSSEPASLHDQSMEWEVYSLVLRGINYYNTIPCWNKILLKFLESRYYNWGYWFSKKTEYEILSRQNYFTVFFVDGPICRNLSLPKLWKRKNV